MEGIHVAFEGRTNQPDDLKFTQQGAPVLSFGAVVTDRKGMPQWLRVSVWKERAEELADVLEKGMEVYVEGLLTVSEWESGGEKRHGLNVSASRCEVLGLIGRRAPGQQGETAGRPAPSRLTDTRRAG